MTPFTEPLLAHIVRAFTDEDVEVRSNAAFAVGALVENSQQDISSQYLNILISLRPYFEVAPGSADNLFMARDNAVGCVARIIVKNMPEAQLEQVSLRLGLALVVFRIFKPNLDFARSFLPS